LTDRTVRTRIAPSPTGDPHIGTAFMALFNYAFAKKHGGQFLLRIEDTDQTRSTRESEQAIYDALHWVGIPWDEGPNLGGPCAPYRQSERTTIYQDHAKILLEKGHAYPCFCTAERLDDLRRRQQLAKQPAGYDAKCASIPKEEAAARMAAGESHVIRMKVPIEGDCILQDWLRGKVVIPWANVDHQILMKSDGFPTYHLANVVDDHLMEITHVIRGEEWISSAPKHQLLYQYFGWEMPELIHLPLLRNPDKSKLSKRKNPTSILYYRQAGFLPEALLNYLGMMGYTMADGREIFTLDEFVECFDIDRISLGGPIFDLQKLTWLNGRYLREHMSPEQLLDKLKAWTLNDATWLKLLPLAQTRIEKLSDLVPMTAFMFADNVDYDAQKLILKNLADGQSVRLLKLAQWELEKLRVWDKTTIAAALTNICEKEGLKPRDAMPLFFTAITGTPTSIPLFDSMEIIGSDMSRRRMVYAQEKLAATGFELKGKPLKELETYYAKTYGTPA
jgi:glutamyl-tRNA synthetase